MVSVNVYNKEEFQMREFNSRDSSSFINIIFINTLRMLFLTRKNKDVLLFSIEVNDLDEYKKFSLY